MTSIPRGPRQRPTPREPYGGTPSGLPIAAIVSVVGLLVVAIVTFSLGSGDLPFGIGGGGGGGGTGPGQSGKPDVARTPTPSNVVVVPSEDPGVKVPGTIVYAKDGNIWLQSNGEATQLTNSGRDSMPSFSEDGQAVYFVRTRQDDGLWSVNGVLKKYVLDIPSILRVPVSGGTPTKILDGVVDPAGSWKWMGFIRGPVISPDGKTVAMVSDLPDPTRSDVTLKLLNVANGRITDLGLSQRPPLGHQDATWRPDGLKLAYVFADRDGAKGTPSIWAWDIKTKKSRQITGPGYLQPSYSPDGRYIAATKTSAFGTDVVIIDTSTGAELLKLTDDGASWAPSWSPAGDQVAFLHVDGQVVDLRLVQLAGSAPSWTVGETIDLTSAAGLDGISRPDWHIPADQLPAPAPATPAPSASTTP